MLVDMHLHELTHSSDSFISLKEIVACARQKGLDAVCITDHDSMGLKDQAEAYSKKTGFPIFVGIEFFSLRGDITAWGLETYPNERIGAQPFIDQVKEAKGFCAACHPFRNNNRGLEDYLREVKGLDAVEVLNGSTSLEANRLALRFCKELGLKPIGASDAHILSRIGRYATWLPEKVDNLKDFIAQLTICQTRPAIWNGLGYDVVEEF